MPADKDVRNPLVDEWRGLKSSIRYVQRPGLETSSIWYFCRSFAFLYGSGYRDLYEEILEELQEISDDSLTAHDDDRILMKCVSVTSWQVVTSYRRDPLEQLPLLGDLSRRITASSYEMSKDTLSEMSLLLSQARERLLVSCFEEHLRSDNRHRMTVMEDRLMGLLIILAGIVEGALKNDILEVATGTAIVARSTGLAPVSFARDLVKFLEKP